MERACLGEEGGCDARGFLDFLFVFTGNGEASGFPFRTCFSNVDLLLPVFTPRSEHFFAKSKKRKEIDVFFLSLFPTVASGLTPGTLTLTNPLFVYGSTPLWSDIQDILGMEMKPEVQPPQSPESDGETAM